MRRVVKGASKRLDMINYVRTINSSFHTPVSLTNSLVLRSTSETAYMTIPGLKDIHISREVVKQPIYNFGCISRFGSHDGQNLRKGIAMDVADAELWSRGPIIQ